MRRFTLVTTVAIALVVSGCCKMLGSSKANEEKPDTTTAKPTTTATDHSAVPSVSEWGSAPHLTLAGQPDGCEVRTVREWYQLYCRHCEHDKRGGGVICSERARWDKGTVTRGSGHGEVFFWDKNDAVTHATSSSVVFPLRKGSDLEIKLPGVGGPDAVVDAVWPHGAPSGTVRFR